MPVTVVKEFTFDAAHYLPGYEGACQNLHGHTYRLQVGFKGEVDEKTGMVIDFSQIKKQIGKLVNRLDHAYLNQIDFMYFPKEMPTAENMVVWLVNRIQTAPLDFVKQLEFVRLYETPTSYAEWKSSMKEQPRITIQGPSISREMIEETLNRR